MSNYHLTLTCPCGAQLTYASSYGSDVRVEREAFDKAHAVCREARADLERAKAGLAPGYDNTAQLRGVLSEGLWACCEKVAADGAITAADIDERIADLERTATRLEGKPLRRRRPIITNDPPQPADIPAETASCTDEEPADPARLTAACLSGDHASCLGVISGADAYCLCPCHRAIDEETT